MTGPWPSLADPLWLLLLVALPALAWLHHRRSASRREGARSDPHPTGTGALAYSRLPRRGSGGRGWLSSSMWRLHLPFYLRLAAAALVILALARPQLGYAWEESLTEGIDIQIALDVSGSMQALDFGEQNRLEVAQGVVNRFIEGRTGDRIGVVVFSGAALTRAPLTTDHSMLRFLVDTVEVGGLPNGTALGVALATAAARLEESDAESQVVVLVTDGVNNAGEIHPRAAASLCDGLGIKVYTIGVGTGGRVPIPVTIQDERTGRSEVRTVLRDLPVDEALLQEIAVRTGGRYYRATDRETLEAVFAEIDRLEKTEFVVKRYVRYRDVFQPLAWTALGLVLLPLAPAALGWTPEP